MLNRIKNLFSLLYSYRNIIIKAIVFEIYFSLKNLEIKPNIKIHKSNFATDTIPCIYYFLFEISKFIKQKKIKSVTDLGSGYGRVVNFISEENKITTHGIELNYKVYKKSLLLKNYKVKLYNDNILKVNFSKFNSECFILVDPLKKTKDKKKLIEKIKKLKKIKKHLFIIAVNMDKKLFNKNIKILKYIIGSEDKSLYFYEVI